MIFIHRLREKTHHLPGAATWRRFTMLSRRVDDRRAETVSSFETSTHVSSPDQAMCLTRALCSSGIAGTISLIMSFRATPKPQPKSVRLSMLSHGMFLISNISGGADGVQCSGQTTAGYGAHLGRASSDSSSQKPASLTGSPVLCGMAVGPLLLEHVIC
jgi:hypothetical protein